MINMRFTACLALACMFTVGTALYKHEDLARMIEAGRRYPSMSVDDIITSSISDSGSGGSVALRAESEDTETDTASQQPENGNANLGASMSYDVIAKAHDDFYKGINQYCGHNWAVDFPNRDTSVTSHQSCRNLCDADATCLAVSVSIHDDGCVKCNKDSIDWAAGNLYANSAWTTYTKAPLPCVTPAAFDIAWRHTEAWCFDNQGTQSDTYAITKGLDHATATDEDGVIHQMTSRAGVQWIGSTFWVCGCQVGTYRIRGANTLGGNTNSCNNILGPSYCPVEMPFESGGLVTGCGLVDRPAGEQWFNDCSVSPQLPAYFS